MVRGWCVDGAFLAFEVLGQRRAYGSVALLSGGSAGEELLSEGPVLRRQGGLGGHLGGANPGLEFEKGELGVAEGFRPGTVLFEQEEPDFLLEQEVALIQPKVALFEQGDA